MPPARRPSFGFSQPQPDPPPIPPAPRSRHNADGSLTWQYDHQYGDAEGAYFGFNAPVAGGGIAGLTIGPSSDDAFDIYGQAGVGSSGPFWGYAKSSKSALEGLSGAASVGRISKGYDKGRGQYAPNTVVTPDGAIPAVGGGSKGRAITYGVNLDEAAQGRGEYLQTLRDWIDRKVGALEQAAD